MCVREREFGNDNSYRGFQGVPRRETLTLSLITQVLNSISYLIPELVDAAK